jgi:hypothetical protein
VESKDQGGGLPGWALALAGVVVVMGPIVAWNLGTPPPKPDRPPGVPVASPLALTADPAKPPAPAATSAPAPPSKPGSAVVDLPADERVWDGHKWRRTPAGHHHGRDCGHFLDGNRWKAFAADPREYPDATDIQRARPESGLYDYDGKVWFLRDHVHGPGCFHHLKDRVWYLDD